MSADLLLSPLALALLVMVWLGLLAASRWRPLVARWPSSTAECAAAGLLGLLTIGFFWRVLLTREASAPAGGGDFNSFYYPLTRFAADQLQAGQLPLWNPTLHAGAPLAADFQAALLYPPNLLAFWLIRPFDYGALVALAIGHYWLASLTMYALWRGQAGSHPAAITAGLTYAYGGFLVAHFGHPPMLAVAAWLPLLLLCLQRLLVAMPALLEGWDGTAALPRRQRLRRLLQASAGWTRWLAAGAAVLALMVLAGHPQLLLIGLVVAVLWSMAVAASASPSFRRLGRPLLRYWLVAGLSGALVVGLGLTLAAPVLLPALQLGQRSVRAALSYAESTAFSLRPLHLLHLLVPKAYGDSPTSYLDAISFNGEVWSYAGVITLLLAGLAAWLRLRGMVLIGLVLVGLALLLELGPATPLHGWLYRFVPGFGQVRAPGRWALVYSLGLALAAAGGVDGLVAFARVRATAEAAALRRLAGRLAVAAGLLLLLAGLLVGQLLAVREPSAPLANFVDGLGWLLILVLLATLLLAGLGNRRLGPSVAGVLLTGLTLLDLFSAHHAFNPTTADLLRGFRHPEISAALAASPATIRLDSDTGSPELWQPSTAAVAGLQDVGGAYNPLGLADYATFYGVARRDRTAPLYDLLAVTHLVARPDRLPRAGQLTPVVTAPSRLVLYERSGSLSRAMVIYQAEVLSNPELALARMREPDWQPRRQVVLSEGPALPVDATAPTGQAATLVRAGSDWLEIDATAAREAYLVVADAYYPGWRAEVNGQPAPVLRANYAFRAVPLPAGRHTVRLIFDPPLWRLGWLLAALAAGVLALALLMTHWRAGRRAPSRPD